MEAASWFQQQELKHSQPTSLPFPYRCFRRDGVGGADGRRRRDDVFDRRAGLALEERADGLEAVAYTHLTLQTNREV